jgi:hypothetical protein
MRRLSADAQKPPKSPASPAPTVHSLQQRVLDLEAHLEAANLVIADLETQLETVEAQLATLRTPPSMIDEPPKGAIVEPPIDNPADWG